MKKFLVALSLLFVVFAHECIHDQVQGPTFEMEEGQVDTDERKMAGIADVQTHPFRIHFDTSNIQNVEEPYKSIIEKQLISYAKHFFEKRLKVKRLSGNVVFPSYKSTCYKVALPQEHKTTGVDTDLLIYVTAENNPSASFTAWASTCMTSSEVNGRAVAGQVNFNTAYISATKKDISAEIMTTLHEVTHILGVSGSSFRRYVDKKGNPRTDITESLTWRGMQTTILKTPKLVEVSRDHFKCNTLRGMELENQGGGGTLGSHFERTILHNEVMTGSRIALRAYSKFTFAALEDSGWFIPDYEEAEPFFWGMDEGCDFIDKGCTGTNFREFCTGSDKGCTFHHNARGYCANGQMSDNCNYIHGWGNGDCRNPENAGRAYYGEVYGSKSKCLMSSLLDSRYSNSGRSDPRCFEYSCNDLHTQVTVKAGNGNTAVCSKEGEQKSIQGYSGSVVCPDPKSFCRQYYPNCPNYCSSHGHCIKGKCECVPGRAGDDCSIENNCPNGCSKNGQCQLDNTCKCNVGYSGIDCSKFTCATSCGANGKCVAPNKCGCLDGWQGDNCDQPVCNECVNGKCVGPNQCTCNAGWKGTDCSEAICKNDCSSSGTCTAPNQCTCNSGSSGIIFSINFLGDDCSVKISGGAACTTRSDCSNRGFCDESKCLCWDGFIGDNCNKFNKECPKCVNGRCSYSIRYSSSSLTSTTTTRCRCYSGWTGTLCSEKAATCPNNCSGKGFCSSGKCYCYSGSSGTDCSAAA